MSASSGTPRLRETNAKPWCARRSTASLRPKTQLFARIAVCLCMITLASSASSARAAEVNEQTLTERTNEATPAIGEDSAEERTMDSGSDDSGPSAMHSGDAFTMWQRTVSDQPVNVSVLFNAGLAAARADKLGYARLYLERARVLAPFDREARDTLALVKQAIGREQLEALGGDKYTEGSPAGVGSWRLTRLLPESASALCFAVFLWLFALGFVADNRRQGTRRHMAATAVMIAGLTLALIAGAFWGGARWTGGRITPAVVVATSPVYQTTPDELGVALTSAELYEGALVAIEAQSGIWSRVRLADESTVWVRDRMIAPLAPGGGS